MPYLIVYGIVWVAYGLRLWDGKTLGDAAVSWTLAAFWPVVILGRLMERLRL